MVSINSSVVLAVLLFYFKVLFKNKENTEHGVFINNTIIIFLFFSINKSEMCSEVLMWSKFLVRWSEGVSEEELC